MNPNDKEFEKFLGKAKPKVQPDPYTKQAFHTDKWDRKRMDQVYDEVKDFVVANDKLADHVSTGYEAMGDTFISFLKPVPELKPESEVRPSFRINRAVMGEVTELQDWEQLRQISIGDPIGAAISAVNMEPQLEIIFDKFKEAQKLADEMEKLLQEMEGLSAEDADLDEMIANAQNGESEEGDAKDYQQMKEAIEKQMELLQKMLEGTEEEFQAALQEELENAKPAIAKAFKEALEDMDGAASFDGWGLGQGGLKKMPPAKRLELAKKLQSEKFKKMAEIIGKLQRSAIAAQHSKVVNTQDEIHDIEAGNDLTHMLPIELLYFGDDTMSMDWFRRYTEHGLLQYALHGTERVNRGGIGIIEDGSGSMSGEREIWAKGIGLALLKIAMMQKRNFFAIHFGGTGEYKFFDYDTSNPNLLKVKTWDNKGTKEEFTGIEAVMSYAECFFGGGTDFHTPLALALQHMQEENKTKGCVESDIVFLTDGQAGLSEAFMGNLSEEQERLGFKIFGVNIAGHVQSEPLYTVCNGNVVVPGDITDGTDVKGIFGTI